MKPVYFKEVNTTFAKDQKEYNQLPAYKIESELGEVISCWNLSFAERMRILFTGKLWVCLLSFNKPLTPSLFSTKKSEVITKPKK